MGGVQQAVVRKCTDQGQSSWAAIGIKPQMLDQMRCPASCVVLYAPISPCGLQLGVILSLGEPWVMAGDTPGCHTWGGGRVY